MHHHHHDPQNHHISRPAAIMTNPLSFLNGGQQSHHIQGGFPGSRYDNYANHHQHMAPRQSTLISLKATPSQQYPHHQSTYQQQYPAPPGFTTSQVPPDSCSKHLSSHQKQSGPIDLYKAAAVGDIVSLQAAMSSSHDIDRTDSTGHTALHYASASGQLACVKHLLEHNADIDLEDYTGCTAVFLAAAGGHADVCRVLIDEGCMVDRQNYESGNTALHEAAARGFSSTVALLVRAKANVYLGNRDGCTPLHAAAQAGHNQSARVLLYAGCSPDVKNSFGDTALHTCARYDSLGVARALLTSNCRISEQNRNGDTALHISVSLHRKKMAKLLLESGIDCTPINKQNETALDIAIMKRHDELVDMIQFQLANPVKKQQRDVSHPRTARVTNIAQVPQNLGRRRPVETKKPSVKKLLACNMAEKSMSTVWNHHAPKNHIRPIDDALDMTGLDEDDEEEVKKRSGFFGNYVYQDGQQYYTDLTGNIRQGPVGYVLSKDYNGPTRPLHPTQLGGRDNFMLSDSQSVIRNNHAAEVTMDQENLHGMPKPAKYLPKELPNVWLTRKNGQQPNNNVAMPMTNGAKQSSTKRKFMSGKSWMERRLDVLVHKIFPGKKAKGTSTVEGWGDRAKQDNTRAPQETMVITNRSKGFSSQVFPGSREARSSVKQPNVRTDKGPGRDPALASRAFRNAFAPPPGRLVRARSDDTLSVSDYKCQTYKKYHKMTRQTMDDNRFDTDASARMFMPHPFAPPAMQLATDPNSDIEDAGDVSVSQDAGDSFSHGSVEERAHDNFFYGTGAVPMRPESPGKQHLTRIRTNPLTSRSELQIQDWMQSQPCLPSVPKPTALKPSQSSDFPMMPSYLQAPSSQTPPRAFKPPNVPFETPSTISENPTPDTSGGDNQHSGTSSSGLGNLESRSTEQQQSLKRSGPTMPITKPESLRAMMNFLNELKDQKDSVNSTPTKTPLFTPQLRQNSGGSLHSSRPASFIGELSKSIASRHATMLPPLGRPPSDFCDTTPFKTAQSAANYASWTLERRPVAMATDEVVMRDRAASMNSWSRTSWVASQAKSETVSPSNQSLASAAAKICETTSNVGDRSHGNDTTADEESQSPGVVSYHSSSGYDSTTHSYSRLVATATLQVQNMTPPQDTISNRLATPSTVIHRPQHKTSSFATATSSSNIPFADDFQTLQAPEIV